MKEIEYGIRWDGKRRERGRKVTRVITRTKRGREEGIEIIGME